MSLHASGEGVQMTQYEVVRPTFAGDFRVLTARILIPDGTILLPSDAGCAFSSSKHTAEEAVLRLVYICLGLNHMYGRTEAICKCAFVLG